MKIATPHSVKSKLVAVAVAAMLGASLVPSASAAPATVSPADLAKNQTITVTSGTDISGKKLVAIPLAYYSSAFADGTTLTGFDLQDSGQAAKIVQALTVAGISPSGDQWDATNPMVWVVQNLLDSKDSPWAGQLRDFVTQLNKKLAGVNGTNLTTAGNNKTMRASVKPGVYLITDRTATGQAAIPMLNGTGINGITRLKGEDSETTYTLGSAEYKASTITIDKVFSTGDQEKATAQIGDTVQYTVTTTVPNWTGYDDFDFRIDDDLSNGLTFVRVDSVMVGDTDITDNNTLWKVTTPDSSNNFSIVFAPADGTDKGSNLISKKNNFPVGEDVTVKYTARLDEDAVIGGKGNSNSVDVVYSHNPNDSSQMDTVPSEHEPTVRTGRISINKHDNEDQPLAGARFNIKRGGTNVKFKKVSEGNYRVADTDEQGTTEVLETPTSGIIVVTGLDGDYTVVETESPFDAPVLPTFDINAAVNAENGDTSATLTAADRDNLVTKGDGAFEFDVLNVRNLFDMPKTGATWLTIYGIGTVCLFGGAVILLRRKQQD